RGLPESDRDQQHDSTAQRFPPGHGRAHDQPALECLHGRDQRQDSAGQRGPARNGRRLGRIGSLSARAAKKKRQLVLKTSSASGGAPTISVPLRLTKSAKKKLRQKGKVKASARITFTPTGGTTSSQTAALKTKGKKPKKK